MHAGSLFKKNSLYTVKEEYLHYRIEELADNSDFIAWIIRGQNKKEWDSFLNDHPEFTDSVNKARKIILALHDRSDESYSKELAEIWANIASFDRLYKKERKVFPIAKILRYAAVFIGVVAIGVSLFYYSRQGQPSGYVFNTSPEPSDQQHSQIVLADGTAVSLENESSNIAMTGDDQLIIDSTRVIDMKELKSSDAMKMNEVFIPYGKRSQIVLADGTHVWLNAGSRLAFPSQFNGNQREIYLEGEAYFEVAHNEEQPFVVNTDVVTVKVLGTKFNLCAYTSEPVAETTLLEGKVAMKDLTRTQLFNRETILMPNQKGSYNKEERKISVQDEPDADLSIAWIEGWLEFHQQPLNSVLSKLERYYNVQFSEESAKVTDALISGKLDLKDSLEQVLTVLSDVSGLRYELKGNQINVRMKSNQ